MCQKVFKYILVVSCKYTSPNQHECSSPPKSNEGREQLLYMCREQLLHIEERALLDGHEEDAKHELRKRRAGTRCISRSACQRWCFVSLVDALLTLARVLE